MVSIRKVITEPGEVIGYRTVFEENPLLRTGVPEKQGTVDRVEYTTAVYENGKTYRKNAYVYLPWCYDREDRDRKYNVLYFTHGHTCEPTLFIGGGNKYMFDMLFDSGELDPCIIVFISYYLDPMGEADVRFDTGGAEAGDGWTAGIPARFDKEIIQDIIPAVEMRYSTYLEDASDAGIRASRDHRAFSGYSRGSMWTWRMFHHAFTYFRWYCPTSGHLACDAAMPVPFGSGPVPVFTDEEIIEYITQPINENPDLPFFIYAGSGGKSDPSGLPPQISLLSEQGQFSYGNDPAVNNLCYTVSDYYHADCMIPYYFWNYLKVIFKV
ncbi:MAG: hypothetical protein J6P87_09000 [Lachnospiraceae bacterium]|nr:hypothetical protein [Lachnospiraceae bacterium]